LKDGWPASAPKRAGEKRIIEAASRPADWVMAAVSGAPDEACSLAAGASRRDVALSEQGMPWSATGDFLHAARGKEGPCIMPAIFLSITVCSRS